MVWIPDHIFYDAQKQQGVQKKFTKEWIPDHLFYSRKKGQGKQWSKHQRGFQSERRFRGAIRYPKQCVWVGGIKHGVTFQELRDHGAQAGTAKWAEVYSHNGKGTGVIGYATEEEAINAAAALSGTRLKGGVLEVDLYERQNKSTKSFKKPWMQKHRIWGQKKQRFSNIRNTSNVVWVSGLPDGATFQKLKAHAEKAGGNVKWAEVFAGKGKGTGLIGYATSEEAASAALELNGSVFNNMTIETDLYTRGNDIVSEEKPKAKNDSKTSNGRKRKQLR